MSDVKGNGKWQQFIFSLIAQLVLPLMPIFIEWCVTGGVDEKTLAISASMYCISIGVATKNLALLGISIVVAMLFSAVFGSLAAGNVPHFYVRIFSIITIVAFMAIHAIERYKRHIQAGELFFLVGDSGT
ncbi:MAG: hypothetical protein JSR66_21025 [Proteobacteria bacterium]|nr:hypothetical protein [Pseudomonadota bacterium]